MLTKWGKEIVDYNGPKVGLIGTNFSGSSNYGVISGKDSAGTSMYMGPFPNQDSLDLLTSTQGTGNGARMGVAVGSSNVAATDEDYDLGSVISTVSAPSPSPVTYHDSENHTYYVYVQYTITNTGSSDITINEVGRFLRMYKAESLDAQCAYANNNMYTVMIDHTILEEPVVIAAGESGIVRYKFTYSE